MDMQIALPSVLVLEDDPLILLELQQDLEELGWCVEHSATRIDEAKKLATKVDVDLAILDIKINGVRSYPVAEVLKRRGIPLIFITGYLVGRIAKYPEVKILSKPFSFADLEHAIRHTLVATPVVSSAKTAPSDRLKRH